MPKSIYFIAIILIAFGIVIPQCASAGFSDWIESTAFNIFVSPNATKSVEGLSQAERDAIMQDEAARSENLKSIDSALGKVQDTLGFLDSAAKGVLMAVIFALATLALVVASTLANIMGSLFLWIISASGSVSFTHIIGPDANPVVAAGWPIARNLANMVIVLGFIVIGISTALRFRDYEAKKLLPKLIGAALLVNFSLLFCGLMIDGANFIMTGLGAGSGGFLARTWTESISQGVDTMWQNFDTNQVAVFLGNTVNIIFSEIVKIVVFALFFFLFLFRYFALWILVILSPLAFVFWVFPATQKFHRMWWDNFVQWCIVGIPGMFFLWLGDTIGSTMAKQTGNTPGTAGGVVLTFMAFLVPGLFMIIGFIFSLQISAMGAGIAISSFKKVGKGALKFGTETTGASRATQWAKNKSGQALEFLRLKSEGSTARTRDKEREEVSKNVGALTEDRKTQLAQGVGIMKGGYTKEGADKREAAIRDKITNNRLDDLGDINAQHQALAWVESRERSRGIGKAGELSTIRASASKSNPLLAGMDSDYVADQISKGKATNVQDINYGQLKRSWKDMNIGARSKIDFTNAAQFNVANAKEFIMNNTSDVVEATRSLPTGNATRTANTGLLKNMVGTRVSTAPADLSTTANGRTSKEIDEELEKAYDRGDTNAERKWKEARNKIHSL